MGHKLSSFLDDLLQFKFNGLVNLSLNTLVENENSLLETFTSKQASFHKTCRNHYDCYDNCAVPSAEPSDIKRRRSTRQLNSIKNNCLFCNKEDSKENLRQVYIRVRRGANLLNDFNLLTKIEKKNK